MKRFTCGSLGVLLWMLGTVSPCLAQNVLLIGDTTSTPGAPATVTVYLTHSQPIQGFQTAVTYDNTTLTLVEMNTNNLDVEALLAPDTVEFFLPTMNPDVAPNTGWGAVAVIFDTTNPFNGQLLPPGSTQSIVNYQFEVVMNMTLIGTTLTVDLTDGFGPPPGIENLITVNSSSVNPILVSGSIDVVDEPALIRGDANGDGTVNVADGIFLVQYLFITGSTPPCFDAADANDDGGLDVSDFIYLVFFQFLDGPAPPAPHPTCGIDSSPDALGCASFPACS